MPYSEHHDHLKRFFPANAPHKEFDEDNKNKSGLFNPVITDQAHLDAHASSGEVGQMVPPGVVVPYAGGKASIPQGWLLCDGGAVSREEYQPLFAAIGTVFGVGDGVDTFNIPDMRGRFPFGHEAGKATLGDTGGAWDHTHGSSAMDVSGAGLHTHVVSGSTGNGGSHSHATEAAHTHGAGSLTTGSSNANAGRDFGASDVAATTHGHDVSGSTGSGGGHGHGSAGNHDHGVDQIDTETGGSSHNHGVEGSTDSNNPPYMALHYIIKT